MRSRRPSGSRLPLLVVEIVAGFVIGAFALGIEQFGGRAEIFWAATLASWLVFFLLNRFLVVPKQRLSKRDRKKVTDTENDRSGSSS